MKTKVIAAAAVLGITALASWSPPANAAGCLKGALIGGLAGHFAGHGILGAGAGCLVGRHYANRAPRTQMTQSQTRTVTRDYDTTLNRTVTRDASTVPVMRRQQSERSATDRPTPSRCATTVDVKFGMPGAVRLSAPRPARIAPSLC